MGQLFDKSMSELREAFVRARFAEPAMFGRSDIFEWIDAYDARALIKEPAAWDSPAFLRWIKDSLDGQLLASRRIIVLESMATPVSAIPDGLFVESRHETARTLLKTLRRGANVYYANGAQKIVIVGHGAALTMARGAANDDVTIRPTTADDVLWVTFEEFRLNKPKSCEALAWMKGMYADAIRFVRDAAVRDFEEAVAVSADGTKIIRARWVVVYDAHDKHAPAVIFPHTAFQRSKALLSTDHVGHATITLNPDPTTPTDELIAKTIRHLHHERRGWNRNPWQTYLSGNVRIGSALLIDPKQCPSPLPEGGREIKI